MRRFYVAVLSLFSLAGCAHGAPAEHARGVADAPVDAVARSNAFARRLIEADARFDPESLIVLGDARIDARVPDLGRDRDERAVREYRAIEEEYRRAAASESNPEVRTDLEVLARAAQDRHRQIALDAKYQVPFHELSRLIFEGLSPLLEARGSDERKQAALARLEAYAGLAPNTAPITELAERRTRERLDRPGLLFPPKTRVSRYLDNSSAILPGLRAAFAGSGIAGYEKAFARLEQQMNVYDAFVRTVILPRARDGFRMPEEYYAFQVERNGIEAPPREVAQTARRAFADIQRAMEPLAREVAKNRGYAFSDYRSVIRALKREQVPADAIESLYRRRIGELETIIRKERLATLPQHALRFRLGTQADSARIPAPYYDSPTLFGQGPKEGVFVLPAHNAEGPSGRFDDFTFEGATWWLTAHEGRPGHDLQFTRMRENGVSIARGHFAFNSANAEGWGLYAEAMVDAYVPLEARLIVLQARLMRAAHAFLDIELNLGLIDEAEVKRVITNDVVFSEAWANQAVQRYTFWLPGQAPCYFYGYLQFLRLRTDAERELGTRFDLQSFHDRVLAQGMLRFPILRRAVLGRG
ncbi:DUF885 domain-containing protein [Pendulispora brunnea]|uniref:DUF885 domain-containing protein n=1 Tax=Pendulispora brunnea TaxID=2905690 RepID=A0ABZ2K5E6_9BACT